MKTTDRATQDQLKAAAKRELRALLRRHAIHLERAVTKIEARLGEEVRAARNRGPSQKTQDNIRKATALAAAGLDRAAICAAMQIPLTTLHAWHDEYPELWKIELDRAMEAAVVIVQSQAGTDAILEDPEAFIRRARACQRWTKTVGRELFPVGEAPTLSTFHATYYVPVRLADCAEVTKEQYQGTLDLWVAITGDPPLKDISCEMLARFKACIQKMRGLKPGTRIASNTVRKHLKHVQILLDKAGPPGYRNRDAAGIIPTSPAWIKPPRIEERIPRFIAPELLGQVYLATVAMEEPRLPGIKAPAWWKALLVIAFNTQLRRRSLFTLRMSEIDFRNQWLNCPPERMKSCRRQTIHLNEMAMKHLLAIRTDRELVFPWLRSLEHFHKHFHRLQAAAGIPRKDHFGLHDIRKTAASILWEDSPAAAQYALGHSSMNTTMRHYVNGTSIVARALDALPQPAAFAG